MAYIGSVVQARKRRGQPSSGLPARRAARCRHPVSGRRRWRWQAVDLHAASQPLGDVWLGLGVSLVATALHGAVAVALWRAGRRLRSITLRADAKHLLT